MSGSSDWHSRGYLPHFDNGRAIQSITYRLADALPSDVTEKIEELAGTNEVKLQSIERHLDAGHGSCLLRDQRNGRVVEDGWKYFDGICYHLYAWVVMPNHVHVLIEPIGSHSVAQIVQTQKSYTAKVILRQAGGTPALPPRLADGSSAIPTRRVWQREYFDRFIRNAAHFAAAVDYIHDNPVKAGLAHSAREWPWSSARHSWERRRPACLGWRIEK